MTSPSPKVSHMNTEVAFGRMLRDVNVKLFLTSRQAHQMVSHLEQRARKSHRLTPSRPPCRKHNPFRNVLRLQCHYPNPQCHRLALHRTRGPTGVEHGSPQSGVMNPCPSSKRQRKNGGDQSRSRKPIQFRGRVQLQGNRRVSRKVLLSMETARAPNPKRFPRAV